MIGRPCGRPPVARLPKRALSSAPRYHWRPRDMLELIKDRKERRERKKGRRKIEEKIEEHLHGKKLKSSCEIRTASDDYRRQAEHVSAPNEELLSTPEARSHKKTAEVLTCVSSPRSQPVRSCWKRPGAAPKRCADPKRLGANVAWQRVPLEVIETTARFIAPEVKLHWQCLFEVRFGGHSHVLMNVGMRNGKRAREITCNTIRSDKPNGSRPGAEASCRARSSSAPWARCRGCVSRRGAPARGLPRAPSRAAGAREEGIGESLVSSLGRVALGLFLFVELEFAHRAFNYARTCVLRKLPR